ncbi:hypothetical protein PHYPSEUDO_002411 [Phytophthora pseudosyringae]|uniref:Uncharacterized protein n=1 Tax=Phytophthora pseudosyringae TaxID=221518 RepID=A0A8T1VYK1_9STRA|nr:hypothetical protein PHYPSEUDO_002411 [Phytophthora pseudosyringae]
MLRGTSPLTGCTRIIAVKVLESNNLSEDVSNLQIFYSGDLRENKVTKRSDLTAVSYGKGGHRGVTVSTDDEMEVSSDGGLTEDDANDAVEEEVVPAVAQLDEGEFACTASRPHYKCVIAHWVDMDIPVAFLSSRDQTAMNNTSRQVRAIRRRELREAALAREEDNNAAQTRF